MNGPVTVSRGEPTPEELAALVVAIALVTARRRPRPQRHVLARGLPEGPTPPGSWRSGITSATV